MRIQFLNPTQLDAERERCSKLLDPASELYQWCRKTREQLRERFGERIFHPQRMDFHIEVIKWGEEYKADEMLERVAELEGVSISLAFAIGAKSIGVKCPAVQGYGPTHITLAYFPEGVPEPELNDVLKTLSFPE